MFVHRTSQHRQDVRFTFLKIMTNWTTREIRNLLLMPTIAVLFPQHYLPFSNFLKINYLRQFSQFVDLNGKSPLDDSTDKSFEECVEAKDPECMFITGRNYDMMIPYFCGHRPLCSWVPQSLQFVTIISFECRYYIRNNCLRHFLWATVSWTTLMHSIWPRKTSKRSFPLLASSNTSTARYMHPSVSYGLSFKMSKKCTTTFC